MKKHIIFGLLSCVFIGLSPSLSFAENFPTLSWTQINKIYSAENSNDYSVGDYSCWAPLRGNRSGEQPHIELGAAIKTANFRCNTMNLKPEEEVTAVNVKAEKNYNNYRIIFKNSNLKIPITIYCEKK